MGLRKAREKANITQAELAEKLQITQPTVAHWENGVTEPKISKLVEMAKLFNCTVDELVRQNGE